MKSAIRNLCAAVLPMVVLRKLGIPVVDFTPYIELAKEQQEADEKEAAKVIRFDPIDSELHCGHSKIRIEPKSYQYFICKVVLAAPSKYHADLKIHHAKDRENDLGRSAEQAARLLNKRTKAIGLEHDLFKRGKDSTSVSDEYRQYIVKN